jgi:hypothetical protein
MLVKFHAFVQSMDAEDSAYDLKDVGIGHISDKKQDPKYDDGSSTVCPTDDIEYLLKSIDSCRYHPKH